MKILGKGVITLILLALVASATFAESSKEKAGSDEKIVITVRPFTNRGTTLAPDSPTELWIEKHFNVELKPWYGIDNYDGEAVNVRLASGDIPDWIGGFNPSWVDLGVVRELPQEMIRKYLPGYMKWADYYLGDEVWRRTVVDGVNYAVPVALSMASTGKVMGFRADWLRAVGYDPKPVPGTSFFKGPDTLAEIEDVLLKFRNNDPDGDGKQDTYGYMVWKNSTTFDSNFLPNVFGAFGIQLNVWDVKDGKGYYSMVDPNYRDALKYVNTWWEEGIIHPDTVTNVRADVLRAMSNDEFGAWSDLDAWQSNYHAGIWGAYLQKHPDGEIAYSITPAGPDGRRGSWFRDPNWTPWAIGANASDEVTIKIMQIIEEIYTNADIYARIHYGGAEGTRGNGTPMATRYRRKARRQKTPQRERNSAFACSRAMFRTLFRPSTRSTLIPKGMLFSIFSRRIRRRPQVTASARPSTKTNVRCNRIFERLSRSSPGMPLPDRSISMQPGRDTSTP